MSLDPVTPVLPILVVLDQEDSNPSSVSADFIPPTPERVSCSPTSSTPSSSPEERSLKESELLNGEESRVSSHFATDEDYKAAITNITNEAPPAEFRVSDLKLPESSSEVPTQIHQVVDLVSSEDNSDDSEYSHKASHVHIDNKSYITSSSSSSNSSSSSSSPISQKTNGKRRQLISDTAEERKEVILDYEVNESLEKEDHKVNNSEKRSRMFSTMEKEEVSPISKDSSADNESLEKTEERKDPTTLDNKERVPLYGKSVDMKESSLTGNSENHGDTSLAGESEEWDTIQSDRTTGLSTMLDSTAGWIGPNEISLQKSCIAKRTRSQTELMRKNALDTIEHNISELGKMKGEVSASEIDESWDFVPNQAKDSMHLHKEGEDTGIHSIYNKIKKIEEGVHSLSAMEEETKTKKGVSWSNKDTTIGELQPAERTFIVSDPRYGSKLGKVTEALDSLLNMKLSLENIEQMEIMVKIILALCIEFSIKTQGIQEDMIELEDHIKELKGAKEAAEKNKVEIEKQKEEILILTISLEDTKELLTNYKDLAIERAESSNELRLIDETADLRIRLKRETERAKRCELRYSGVECRKNYHKEQCRKLKAESKAEKKVMKEEIQRLKRSKEADKKERTKAARNLQLKEADLHNLAEVTSMNLKAKDTEIRKLMNKNDSLVEQYEELNNCRRNEVNGIKNELETIRLDLNKQLEEEKGCTVIAKSKVEALEMDLSKTRNHYKLMFRDYENRYKTERDEKTKLEKTVNDKEVVIQNQKGTLDEKEIENNVLTATVDTQEKIIQELRKDKKRLEGKMDKMWREVKDIDLSNGKDEGVDMMEESTLTDSGFRGSPSTTGIQGDIDTLDLSTEKPKDPSPANKKRKVDSSPNIEEVTSSTELASIWSDETQNPSLGNHREGLMNPMEPTQATKPPLPPLPQKRALDMTELPYNLHQIEEMGNLVLKGDKMQKYMQGQDDSFSQEFIEFKEKVRGYMKAAPSTNPIPGQPIKEAVTAVQDIPLPSEPIQVPQPIQAPIQVTQEETQDLQQQSWPTQAQIKPTQAPIQPPPGFALQPTQAPMQPISGIDETPPGFEVIQQDSQHMQIALQSTQTPLQPTSGIDEIPPGFEDFQQDTQPILVSPQPIQAPLQPIQAQLHSTTQPKQVYPQPIQAPLQPIQAQLHPQPTQPTQVATGAIPKTLVVEDFTPKVTPVTDDNMQNLSKVYMGLLKNKDGTTAITQQFLTKCANQKLQLVSRHRVRPDKYPAGISNKGHPKISTTRCDWTHEGRWAKMPIDKTKKLRVSNKGYVENKDYRVVRIEKYIDEAGVIKQAVCYSKDASDMEVWFEFDDFKETHPLWEIPEEHEFFNAKVWKEATPYWNTQDKKTVNSNRNRDPRSQPSNPRRNNQQGGQFRQPREYQNQRGYYNREEEYQQWDQEQFEQPQYYQNHRDRSSSRQGRPRERSHNRNRNSDPGYGGYQ